MRSEILKSITQYIESSDFNVSDVEGYVDKIMEKSVIHMIIRNNNLMAFISYYDNDVKKENAYLTMIIVNEPYRGVGYGKSLLQTSIETLRNQGFYDYTLEVSKNNLTAIKLYQDIGFSQSKEMIDSILMTKIL